MALLPAVFFLVFLRLKSARNFASRFHLWCRRRGWCFLVESWGGACGCGGGLAAIITVVLHTGFEEASAAVDDAAVHTISFDSAVACGVSDGGASFTLARMVADSFFCPLRALE